MSHPRWTAGVTLSVSALLMVLAPATWALADDGTTPAADATTTATATATLPADTPAIGTTPATTAPATQSPTATDDDATTGTSATDATATSPDPADTLADAAAPALPTSVRQASCRDLDARYTVPDTQGVEYLVDGAVVSGTFTVTYPASATVTARPATGYRLPGGGADANLGTLTPPLDPTVKCQVTWEFSDLSDSGAGGERAALKITSHSRLTQDYVVTVDDHTQRITLGPGRTVTSRAMPLASVPAGECHTYGVEPVHDSPWWQVHTGLTMQAMVGVDNPDPVPPTPEPTTPAAAATTSAPTPSPTTTHALAITGTDALPFAIAAILLLAAGTCTLIAQRRAIRY